jgi:peptidoglycan/LPS O-acetylase OafA/YrhL
MGRMRWGRNPAITPEPIAPSDSLAHDPGRIAASEGIRGFLALAVFAVHALGFYLLAWRGFNPVDVHVNGFWSARDSLPVTDVVLACLTKAHYLATLFFIISGFFIMRVVQRAGAGFSYREFLVRRFARIYPTALLALGLSVWVGVIHLRAMPLDASALVVNALLLNGAPVVCEQFVSYNHPSWTLFYEAAFYISLPPALMMARCTRQGARIAPYGAVVVLGAVLLVLSCIPRAGMFLFGILMGRKCDAELRELAERLPAATLIGLLLVLCTVFAGMPGIDWHIYVPLFGTVGSLLFVKTCYGGGVLERFFSVGPLRWLGNRSYSLYLVHTSAIWWAGPWLKRKLDVDPVSTFVVFFIASLTLTMLLTIASYGLTERWYFRWVASRSAQPALQVMPQAEQHRAA